MTSTTRPSPIALVVCDNIYQEPGGKTALVGLFNTIRARNFPVTHSRLCVYASVTDVHPKTLFKIDIIHAETDEPVAAMQGPPPDGTTPLSICDMHFVLSNVSFKEPGRYYIRFHGNDHVLLQRPFEVVQSNERRS